MSRRAAQFYVKLAVIVIVWYIALVFLPQIVGTCFDGDCGFSMGEILLSFAIPLAVIAGTILLEARLYSKSWSQALRDIGLTRFSWAGIRIAALFMLPLLAFHPLFSLLSNTTLATQPNWPWILLNVIFINGLAEEIMMRGFVFRHIREGRPFWGAAVIAALYFAAYHIVLIFIAGPLIGVIAVIIAFPAAMFSAYIYERGDNSIWGPALFHAVYNAPALVFVFPTDVQPVASSLYLLIGIAVTSVVLLRAYRAGYGREHSQASQHLIDTASMSSGSAR